MIRKPRACLPKSGKLAGSMPLKPLVMRAPPAHDGARRNRKTEKAGTADAKFGTVARASRQGEELFGREVSSSTAADGTTTAKLTATATPAG